MIRRILFILVFLGLGFIVWRMISPTGANHALDNLKALPGKIFSHDRSSDALSQDDTQKDILETGEVVMESGDSDIILEINEDTGTLLITGEELKEDDTHDKKEDLEALLSGDKDLLADALLDLVAEDQSGESLLSWAEDIFSGDVISGVVASGVEPVEVNTGVVVSPVSATYDCIGEGHIALRTSKSTQCCEDLNWIYYRGDNKSAGVICFDTERWIPQCTHQNTLDEWWYYMDGGLLRKDLDCGKYFGTKYYEVEVSDDRSMLKSILTNIFK